MHYACRVPFLVKLTAEHYQKKSLEDTNKRHTGNTRRYFDPIAKRCFDLELPKPLLYRRGSSRFSLPIAAVGVTKELLRLDVVGVYRRNRTFLPNKKNNVASLICPVTQLAMSTIDADCDISTE